MGSFECFLVELLKIIPHSHPILCVLFVLGIELGLPAMHDGHVANHCVIHPVLGFLKVEGFQCNDPIMLPS